MGDPTAKFIVLALVPLMLTLILILLAFLVVRYGKALIQDKVNLIFWNLRPCYVYGVKRGLVFGERLFVKPNSMYYVRLFLLYGAANAFGLIFTLWWRIVLFDITTDGACNDDFDCFSTKTSQLIGFPKYEACTDKNQTFSSDVVLFCVRFSIPTIDALFVRVGVAYGFTAIVFQIIRFIMQLNAGPKANKIISLVSTIILVIVIILLILLLALLKSFSSWLTKSLINYIIPFMVVLCIIVALILFGCMNRKLIECRDPFDDGDLVYYVRKKEN